MKQLTKKRKLEFIEYAIEHLKDPEKRKIATIDGHRKFATWGICEKYVQWKSLNVWTAIYSLVDETITIEFPELMIHIIKAKKKHGVGTDSYINYKLNYRFKGRINLLNRVKKQLNEKTK